MLTLRLGMRMNTTKWLAPWRGFSAREHLIYWATPALVIATMIAMYFSGVDVLVELIAPGGNRELGIVENAQHLILLVLLGFVIVVFRRSWGGERLAWGMVAAAVAFMLLEELDYGLHYIEAVRGLPEGSLAKVRNIHNANQGVSPRMKNVGDLVTLLLFVVFPLLAWRRADQPLIRYFAPSRLAVLTVVIVFLLSRVAHLLEDVGINAQGSLHGNISEFRELSTYYLWLLYFVELGYRRPRPWRSQAAVPPEDRREAAAL